LDEFKKLRQEMQQELQSICQRIQALENRYERKASKTSLCYELLNEDERAIIIEDETISLTPLEFRTMEVILSSDRLFCSYDDVAKKIYACSTFKHVHRPWLTVISRLSRKLKGLVEFKTVRNKGFKIVSIKGYDKERLL
jgi:DNA-binding response OmpR family regulator